MGRMVSGISRGYFFPPLKPMSSVKDASNSFHVGLDAEEKKQMTKKL